MPAYLCALSQESARYHDEKADTVFIGGGTPSYLYDGAIMQMLESIGAHINIMQAKEITIECNPCSLTKEKLQEYKHAGINRLSVGAQSFDPRMLKMLGRSHTAEQFAQAFSWAREAGFTNINFDLISDLPGQSLEQWKKTLETACRFAPEHISCYSLTVEPATPLGKKVQQGLLQLPPEETDREMYYATGEILAKHGYEQYEISNYAKAGKACLHNLNYWLSGEYIGLGCAAHSYFRGVRYANITQLDAYIRAMAAGQSAKIEESLIGRKEQIFESLMLELRLNSGLSRSRFAERFGEDVTDIYGVILEKQQAKGLLEITPAAVRLTKKGRDFADGILLEYMD